MRIVSMLLLCLLFSGCVSFQTGLQIAQFGVNVGFDIKDYMDTKKEEFKDLKDANRSE